MKVSPCVRDGRTRFDIVDVTSLGEFQALLQLLSSGAGCSITEVAAGPDARVALIHFRKCKVLIMWDDMSGTELHANQDSDQAAAEDLAGFIAGSELPGISRGD